MAETLSLTSTVIVYAITMPRLGFGTHETTKDAVLAALTAGYRLIDTARVYGDSETVIGEAIKESGLDRKELFITTKITPDKCDQVSATVEKSLQELQLDYIDLLLLHGAHKQKDKRLAMYKALIELKEADKIVSFGVSNFNIDYLEEIREAGLPCPAVNQLEHHSIVVQAYCPIMRGTAGNHEVIKALAKKYKREPTQIVLRWSLQKGFVPLPKSNTPARIISNSELYDFKLELEDIEELDAMDLGKKGSFIDPKYYPPNTP